MALGNGEKIDTPIELEIYKLECKKQRLNTLLKFFIMVLALIGASVLGFIFDGDYTTYTFIFYGIVISFAIGQADKVSNFMEWIKK